MREQIQQLIAEGRTEEALELLEKTTQDAVLLKARYNNGKKQYNMGLIDFSEWNRVQNQVNYAALELAGSGGSPVITAVPSVPVAPVTDSATATRRVAFISYSHMDGEVAYKVSQFLEEKGVDVLIDEDDLQAGKSIMEFIQESIRSSDAVVTIVSANSLQAGWKGLESVAIMYAIWLADAKKFIPVRLDNISFDLDFQIAATEGINQTIDEMEAKISKLKSLGGSPISANEDLSRLYELKNNLGKIFQRLNAVNTLDISSTAFDRNMPRVFDRIMKD